MKHTLKYSLLILLISMVVIGCSKDKLDKNGLTKDINNIVPDYIIDIMKELGMPIYGGDNPPLLTGGLESATYFESPSILIGSTRLDDVIGKRYADYIYTFTKQDNKKLTIYMTEQGGRNSGDGMGAYIVGTDNQFSVFAQLLNHDTRTDAVCKLVEVYSGKIIDGGIEDLHTALFMVDDDGDPDDIWIENGDGRVFYDGDGFSELLYYYDGARRNISNENLPSVISNR